MSPTILVIDDHPLVAEALRLRILATQPRANVVAAWTLEAAIQKAPLCRNLALVLMDLMLPDARGYCGLLLMRQAVRSVPVAIISARNDPDTVAGARAFGAAGFLPKSATPQTFATAVETLLRGREAFPEAPEAAGGERAVALAGRKIDALSAAQLRVLLAVSDGRLNKQVAGEMGLAEVTVKTHMTAILRKLGVSSRIEAITLATQMLNLSRQPYPV